MNISGDTTTDINSNILRLAESLRSRSTFQVVLESLIYTSIIVSGFVGNLLVLYIVYKSARLRNVPGLFIASLALSDIAIIALATPPSLPSLIKGYWVSSFAACQFQGFVVIATVAASLQTMALMSIDRYFRVVHPTKHRFLFTLPRARLMAASVWILALAYPVPYLATVKRFIFHPGKFFCFFVEEESLAADTIYVCIFYSIVVLSYCYINVYRHLRLNAKRVQGWRTNDLKTSTLNAQRVQGRRRQEIKTSAEDAKLTRTLFATVLGYLICWTPVLIIDFVEKGVGEWFLPRWVYVFYNDIGLASSSLNPIIYGAFNRTFRQEYKTIFCFRKSLVNQDQSSTEQKLTQREKVPITEITIN
ncbi:alpha-2Da adrenergic receptor-like [Stylophora pistillata]|nr:alpha-2Da adrenergic receptor-like [Stylophora pistillata]